MKTISNFQQEQKRINRFARGCMSFLKNCFGKVKKSVTIFTKEKESSFVFIKTPHGLRDNPSEEPFFWDLKIKFFYRSFLLFLVFPVFFSSFYGCNPTKKLYNAVFLPVPVHQLPSLPPLTWDDLPGDETSSFYQWVPPFLQQALALDIFTLEEVQTPAKTMSKGQFLSKLCYCLKRPSRIKGTMPFVDIPIHTSLHDDVLFALQQGIIEKPPDNELDPPFFHPDTPIERWEAAVWFTNARQVDFSYYQENVLYILTQDGAAPFPSEQARLAMAVSFHPAYQLLPYRWSTNHEYRLAKPYGFLTYCEASFGLFHMLVPPASQRPIHIAKEGIAPSNDVITKKDFDLLSPYLYVPAISERDMHWGYSPLLVETIPHVDNGSLRILDDGRVQCIYKIRDYLFWSNGDPIVAQDAITGFQFAMQFANSSVPFDWLLGIKVESQDTVLVTWKRPFYGVERAFYLYSQSLEFPLYWDQYVHCASFSIETRDMETIHLVANRKSVTGTIPEASIQIDFYQNTPFVVEEYDLIIPATDSDLIEIPSSHSYIYAPTLQWEHVDLKLPNRILNDISLREKLVSTIHYEDLNQFVWEGNAWLSPGWFLPLHPSLQGKVESLQDIKEGFMDKNVRVEPEPEFLSVVTDEEEQISLRLIVLSSNDKREQTANFLQSSWEDIGVHVNVEFHEEEAFFAMLQEPSKEEARAFLYSWVFTPQTNLFSILHSSCIPGVKENQRAENYTSFQNAHVDLLLLKTLTEPNAEKRARNLYDIQVEALQEARTIPLLYVPKAAICSGDVQGLYIPFSGIAIDWAPYYLYVSNAKETQ
jgi:ABC-type transport system substrate-binding protein